MTARTVFGTIAFFAAILVVSLSLSPWVTDGKEKIAYLVLGNVLSWPVMVLQYYYGAVADKGTQPVRVTNTESNPVHVEQAA
jgi:hypothetical protein